MTECQGKSPGLQGLFGEIFCKNYSRENVRGNVGGNCLELMSRCKGRIQKLPVGDAGGRRVEHTATCPCKITKVPKCSGLYLGHRDQHTSKYTYV